MGKLKEIISAPSAETAETKNSEVSEAEQIEIERQKLVEKKRAQEKKRKKKDLKNLRINEVIVCMGYPEASGVEIVAAHIAKRMQLPVVDIFEGQKEILKTKEPPELYKQISQFAGMVHRNIKRREEKDRQQRARAESNMKKNRALEEKKLAKMLVEKEREERLMEKKRWKDLKEKRDDEKNSMKELIDEDEQKRKENNLKALTGKKFADGSEGSNLSDSSHSELLEELENQEWPWDEKHSWDTKLKKSSGFFSSGSMGAATDPVPVLEIPPGMAIEILKTQVMLPTSLLKGGQGKARPEFQYGFVAMGLPTRKEGAEMLHAMLDKTFGGGAVTRVLEVRSVDAVLVHRLTGNWVHPGSGRRYNLHVRPPKSHLQQRKKEIEERLIRLASGEKMIDIKREEDSELVYIDGIKMPKDPLPEYMKDDFTGEQLERIIVDPYTAIKNVHKYRQMVDKCMNYYSALGKANKLKIAFMLIDGNQKAERLPEATDMSLRQDTSIILPEDGLDGEALFDERKSTWTNPYAITKIRRPNGLSVENKNRVKGRHITAHSEGDNDMDYQKGVGGDDDTEDGAGSGAARQATTSSKQPGMFSCLCACKPKCSRGPRGATGEQSRLSDSVHTASEDAGTEQTSEEIKL